MKAFLGIAVMLLAVGLSQPPVLAQQPARTSATANVFPRDGMYGLAGAEASQSIRRQGDALLVASSQGEFDYQPQADGTFFYPMSMPDHSNGKFLVKVIDAETVDFGWSGDPAVQRYTRRGEYITPALPPPPMRIRLDNQSEPMAVDATVSGQIFEALSILLSGVWLNEDNLQYYEFTWDPITKTLEYDEGLSGIIVRRERVVTVQQLDGVAVFNGRGNHDGRRFRLNFTLIDPRTLASDIYHPGGYRNLRSRDVFRLVNENQLLTYTSDGEPDVGLTHRMTRVLPGDPDGRFARAWVSGAAEMARASAALEASERARREAGGTSELFAFLGAVAGGVVAGSQTGGDITAISAGMAAGSAMASPDSEIASAANTNFQAERQRYEAEREQERQTIAAGRNDPSSSPRSGGDVAAPPPSASGGDGLQPRTVQAYFAWGMALGPNNTRNPRCFSNIFSITYMSDPNGWGDGGRAEAEAGRLASVFRQKCERLGRMDPGTPLAQIGLPGVPFSAPYITAEDYQVSLP